MFQWHGKAILECLSWKKMKTREAIISKEKSSEEKAVKSDLSRLIKNALPNLATVRVTNDL